MLTKISSISIHGIDALEIFVEVSILNRGLPYFDIVGLPDKSVDESKHRVKTAFQNSGFSFPDKKIVVNLAPADIHKEGSFYDFPIAAGILASCLNLHIPEKSLFFGEISLDGSLRHTRGAFLLALYAKEKGFKNIFLPVDCVSEVSYISGINVFGVKDLNSLVNHLSGKFVIHSGNNLIFNEICEKISDSNFDLKNVIGQDFVKRALEICAAGGHNLIMVGPPGAGKTLLAKSLVSILPPLSEVESIEVTKIYSSVGKILPNEGLVRIRPFRSPHHTISYSGMVGGGNIPKPGEITLAHRGILFMDEFNEFSRPVLEALRQPLEDGYISVSRSKSSVIFPSKFVLVASSNPCPCGYFGSKEKTCKCTPKNIENYQKKLSGPIMDRIDLHVPVFSVEKSKLINYEKNLSDKNESSDQVKSRVVFARGIQAERFKNTSIISNAEMFHIDIPKFCSLDEKAKNILDQASSRFSFSARSYFKIIKIARTIADLSNSSEIVFEHMAEALQYRTKFG